MYCETHMSGFCLKFPDPPPSGDIIMRGYDPICWHDLINGIYVNYKASGHFVAKGPYFHDTFRPIIEKWFRGKENIENLTMDFSKAVVPMDWRPDFRADEWDDKIKKYSNLKHGVDEWGYISLDKSRFPQPLWKPKHFFISGNSLMLHNVQSADDLVKLVATVIEICHTSCRTCGEAVAPPLLEQCKSGCSGKHLCSF